MEKIPPLSELIAAVLRHVRISAIIVVIGVVLSVGYALKQARVYQTSTMIQILQPSIANSRDRGPSSAPTLQLLQVVEQRLMTRDNLIKVIEKHNLYGGGGGTLNEKVLALRLATQFEMIMDQNLRWRSDISPTALVIQVKDGNPELAANLANEFAERLMMQNRESRENQAQVALAFFESEEIRVGEEIAILDAQIAAFKQINADLLPAGLKVLRSQQETLDDSLLELEGDIAELKNGSSSGAKSVVAKKLKQLEAQFGLINTRRSEVSARIAQAPQAERNFVVLTRKLKQLNDQFNVINKSRAEAKMGQMLETGRQGANFRVLETALVPSYPIAPNRKKIVLMGVVGSMVIAFLVTVLLELRKPVIRTSAQMERKLDLRPVVSIPTLAAPRSVDAARKAKLLWLGVGAVFALLLAVFVFSS